MQQFLIVSLLLACTCWTTPPAVAAVPWPDRSHSKAADLRLTGVDSDGDGLDDGYEQYLLNSLGPIFSVQGASKQSPPSSLAWAVRHGQGVWETSDREKSKWSPKGKDDPAADLLKAVKAKQFDDDDFLDLSGPMRFGKVKGDEMTWKRAQEQGLGTFGRVRRSPSHDDRVWVQYYMFLPFNDADVVFDVGDHEGDWLCLDMDADVSNPTVPVVKWVIYHNHGRVFAVPGDNAPRKAGRILAYMEGGCNELWPGTDDSLPAGSVKFHDKFADCRKHRGAANVFYVFGGGALEAPKVDVLNVGEKDHPMPYDDKARQQEVGLFFTDLYWGAWSAGIRFGKIAVVDTRPPKAPHQHAKKWERAGIKLE